MKTLDDLLIQRQKLTELVRMAKLLGGKVSIGDDTITLAELKETLDNLKIEIESRRSQIPPLRRVK
jgi:histidinol phosphatase-like PHP family hydrolase